MREWSKRRETRRKGEEEEKGDGKREVQVNCYTLYAFFTHLTVLL